MPYIPSDDGVTHVNVYSRGNTEVGRFLSNFSHSPVELSDGIFQSLEGYWYWLKTRDDALKDMVGNEAKAYGRSQPVVYSVVDRNKFKKALTQKIILNSEWLRSNQLWNNLSLPLTHYYVYNSQAKDAGGEWILEILEQLRFNTIG